MNKYVSRRKRMERLYTNESKIYWFIAASPANEEITLDMIKEEYPEIELEPILNILVQQRLIDWYSNGTEDVVELTTR